MTISSNHFASQLPSTNTMASSHYYTDQQQEEALSKNCVVPAPRHISRSYPTYIHLSVKLTSHYCAVQVTITPFVLSDHPEQTFFSSSFRYAICCTQATSTETNALIIERVQQIYDVYYRPCIWNFSAEQW